jgi:hypothetical protein
MRYQYVIKRVEPTAIVTNFYSLGSTDVNYKWNADSYLLVLDDTAPLAETGEIGVEILKILPGGAGYKILFAKTYLVTQWDSCLKDLLEFLHKEERFAVKELVQPEIYPAGVPYAIV